MAAATLGRSAPAGSYAAALIVGFNPIDLNQRDCRLT